MSRDLYIWRPVMRGLCTIDALRTTLTLDDLADMHELLDLQDALAAAHQKHIQNRRKQ